MLQFENNAKNSLHIRSATLSYWASTPGLSFQQAQNISNGHKYNLFTSLFYVLFHTDNTQHQHKPSHIHTTPTLPYNNTMDIQYRPDNKYLFRRFTVEGCRRESFCAILEPCTTCVRYTEYHRLKTEDDDSETKKFKTCRDYPHKSSSAKTSATSSPTSSPSAAPKRPKSNGNKLPKSDRPFGVAKPLDLSTALTRAPSALFDEFCTTKRKRQEVKRDYADGCLLHLLSQHHLRARCRRTLLSILQRSF